MLNDRFLQDTLSFLECEVCNRPIGYRRFQICYSCMKRLPPPKRLKPNIYIAFTSHEPLDHLSLSLLAGISASRFYQLGGKADRVLKVNDNGFSSYLAACLGAFLVEELIPETLVINTVYRERHTLNNLQYLYITI